MSSDHFSPVERATGRVGLRLVLPRRRAGDDQPAIRRRQRARAALSPGDHRPGHRHARADVSRSVLGGARIGRGLQRAGDRRSLAAQGDARPAPHRMRRRHPAAAARRGGQPRGARARQPRAVVDAARHRPRPRRSGRHPETAARHAAWADGLDHRQPAEGNAAEGPRLLPRGRAAEARPAFRSTSAGRRPRRRRWPSPTTSGAATSSPRRSCWDVETVEAFDVISEDVSPEQVRKSVHVSSDLGRHTAWLQEYVDQGWDELYLHFVGQKQAALHRRVR